MLDAGGLVAQAAEFEDGVCEGVGVGGVGGGDEFAAHRRRHFPLLAEVVALFKESAGGRRERFLGGCAGDEVEVGEFGD